MLKVGGGGLMVIPLSPSGHDTAPGERVDRPLFLDYFDKKEQEKKVGVLYESVFYSALVSHHDCTLVKAT